MYFPDKYSEARFTTVKMLRVLYYICSVTLNLVINLFRETLFMKRTKQKHKKQDDDDHSDSISATPPPTRCPESEMQIASFSPHVKRNASMCVDAETS